MAVRKYLRLFAGLAGSALAYASVAQAQPTEPAPPPVIDESLKPAEEVVVTETRYRDRSTAVAPVLQYGLDYFQRFEPLTVGDMLKRVPSAAFLSDVLEYDGVRLRGLDPGYTQILINGEEVPGSGVDRSFFVDRIPAELIERVEIIRSPSANRSGDAVAGALNIILRDPYSFEGAFVRVGALHFRDDEIKPVIGGVASGAIGDGRGIVGFNIQGRHNPKQKVSYRFEPDSGVLEFDNREDQSDTRDGTDYSFNAEVAFPLGQGVELELAGFYVLTDRTETEHSVELGIRNGFDPEEVASVTPQFEDIRQENFSLDGELTFDMMGGETQIEVGFARFEDDITSTEEEFSYDEEFPDEFEEAEGTREFTDLTDDEWSVEIKHERDLNDMLELEFGLRYKDKRRDGSILVSESELEEGDGPFPQGTPLPPYPTPDPAPDPEDGGVFEIEEQRLDAFVMLTGEVGRVEWEAGLRYEGTDSEVTDVVTAVSQSNDYGFLLPSAHLRFNVSDDDRITFSAARSIRRPNFDFLQPVLLEETPTEDNDLLGNPSLEPETAWGVDVGYERRLGKVGIAGVNIFYRDVTDLIELASTGVVSSSGDGFVFQPRNVGDGTVWGVEFDLSMPLTFIGLENTGVFVNYSWLDSEIEDFQGERRFNDQAESVFNVGFIQDIPVWGMAFGASYRKQGDAFSRVQGETVATSYGADLEAFVEARLWDNVVVRFTGSNLLDESKDETFFKWDTLEDQLSGDIDDLDEFEQESEKSGPVFQVVMRIAL